jgi:hypothetical protein
MVRIPDFAIINISDFVEKWEVACCQKKSSSKAELIIDLPSYCSTPILKQNI